MLTLILAATLATAPMTVGPDETVASWRLKTGMVRMIDDTFLAGAIQAYSGANAFLKQQGEKPLFCPSPQEHLSGTLAAQLVDKFVTKVPALRTSSLDVALLFALRDAYPCRE